MYFISHNIVMKNSMKKISILFLVVSLCFLLLGCLADLYIGSSSIILDEENSVIHGHVTITVGPFPSERAIHELLVEEAREVYGEEVDDVVNISSHLNFYYFTWDFVVSGTAISY